MENRESNDDQDDIESNLLLPAGVTLRWATLSLKVFRAEDVPQSKTSRNYVTLASRSLQPHDTHTRNVNRFKQEVVVVRFSG